MDRPNPFSCFGCGSAALWPAACLIAAVVTCGPPRAFAQPSMQTILTNGPVSNRLNIAVLSEGYTATQLAQFLVDATNAVTALLSHQPYQEYSNYFNAYAIKVASNRSGSTEYLSHHHQQHLLQQYLCPGWGLPDHNPAQLG